jgi:hypothetical protein
MQSVGLYQNPHTFLVLLVNDSEYSQSAGAKLIRSHSCIYLVLLLVRCCYCGSCGLLLLPLSAPTPPRPRFGGGKVPQKKPKKKKTSWWRKNTEKTKKNKEKKARSAPGYIRWA